MIYFKNYNLCCVRSLNVRNDFLRNLLILKFTQLRILNGVKEERRNTLNGILGTIIFHLVVVLVFMFFKLGEARKKHAEILQIEFLNELVKIEEYLAQKDIQPVNIQPLDDQVIRNIAVNVADKLNKEISTEKYIEELKEELGIEEIDQKLDRTLPDDNSPKFVNETLKDLKDESKQEKYQGKTRINVYLPNRLIRRQHEPIYKCQVSGIVVIQIIVDQTGNVINASYSNNSGTKDDCLVEEAIASSYKFRFTADLKGEPKQRGTITFEFMPQ